MLISSSVKRLEREREKKDKSIHNNDNVQLLMRKGEVIFHSLIIFIVLIPEPVSMSNPHKLIK